MFDSLKTPMFVSDLFIKKHNILSIFLFLILLVPFFISQLLQSNEIISANSDFILFINAKNFQEFIISFRNNYSFLFFISYALNIFLLVGFPIFSVTILEILIIKKSKKKSHQLKTSISRIFNSEGSYIADIWYFILGMITSKFPFLAVFLTLGLSSLNKGIGSHITYFLKRIIPDSTTFLSSTLIFIFIILIKDLLTYFVHRLHHRIPFLWEQHEFHHSATQMTMINKYRETTIEKVTRTLLFLPIDVFLTFLSTGFILKGYPFPLFIYLLHLVMKNAFTFLGHASLPIIYPKPLSLIYMSPGLHLIHHSNNEAHYDSNFSEGFVFWDKLFGTYKGKEFLDEINGYGVIGTQYNKHSAFYSFTILPILKTIKFFIRKSSNSF